LSEIIYGGRILTLKLVEVPGKKLEVVEHRGAVVIMPFLSDSEVIVIRQYRYPVSEELVEFPAGTLEVGETPQSCALRELEEETGYRAGELELLGSFYASPGYSTELLYAYVARNLRKGSARPDVDERIKVEKVTLEELLEMVKRGDVRDSKTLATIALYLLKGAKAV